MEVSRAVAKSIYCWDGEQKSAAFHCSKSLAMTMPNFPEGEDEDVKFWQGLRVAATKSCIIAADYRGLVAC